MKIEIAKIVIFIENRKLDFDHPFLAPMETASFFLWSEVVERSGNIRAEQDKDTVDSGNCS